MANRNFRPYCFRDLFLLFQRSNDVEKNQDVPLALGSVVHAGRRWPVFRLNENFEPLFDLPLQNIYCVCLSADDGATGIALICDTVETIRLEANDPIPTMLPTCMQREVTPLQKIFLHNEHLLPVSTAPALANYLKALMKS